MRSIIQPDCIPVSDKFASAPCTFIAEGGGSAALPIFIPDEIWQ